MHRRSFPTGFFYAAAFAGSAAAIGSFATGCLSPDNPLPDEVTAGNGDEVDCSKLTYENFAESFFQSYCLRCHSATLVGDAARNDAPVGINYDTIEGVREFATRIRLRAGQLGDMPPLLAPVPRPGDEARRKLMQWIDCGTPTEADLAGGG